MIARIKDLLKHSAIYGISNASTKLIGIVLLPLYTKFIPLESYGNLAVVDATIVILAEFLNLGQGQTIVWLFNNKDYESRKKKAFFTLLITLVVVNAVIISGAYISVPSVITGIHIAPVFIEYFQLGLIIVFFRAINNYTINTLRAEEKSATYTVVNLIKIAVTVAFAFYFLAYANMNIEGILYAYIVAEVIVMGLLLPYVFSRSSFSFDKTILFAALAFGLPLIFNTLPFHLLNLSDRYILVPFVSKADLGIYDLGYRFAGLINMFIIMPFNLAVMPAVYKIYGQQDDKRYYSKLLTYLCFALVIAALGVSFFAKDVLELFTLNDDYVAAYVVVPIIAFAYIFSGLRLVAVIGLYVKKKTAYIAYTTIAGTLINIALNFWLVPKYGIMAAAWNTVIAFLILFVSSLVYANKYYKIDYEYIRVGALLLLGIVLYIASVFIDTSYIYFDIALKLCLVALFPLILFVTGFFEKNELGAIKNIITFTKPK